MINTFVQSYIIEPSGQTITIIHMKKIHQQNNLYVGSTLTDILHPYNNSFVRDNEKYLCAHWLIVVLMLIG